MSPFGFRCDAMWVIILRCLGAGVPLWVPNQTLPDFSLRCRKKITGRAWSPARDSIAECKDIDIKKGSRILETLTLSRCAVTGMCGTLPHPSPPYSSLLVSPPCRRRPKLSGRGFSPSLKGCVSSWRTMPVTCWLSWGTWSGTLRKCRKKTSLV